MAPKPRGKSAAKAKPKPTPTPKRSQTPKAKSTAKAKAKAKAAEPSEPGPESLPSPSQPSSSPTKKRKVDWKSVNSQPVCDLPVNQKALEYWKTLAKNHATTDPGSSSTNPTPQKDNDADACDTPELSETEENEWVNAIDNALTEGAQQLLVTCNL